MWLTSPPIDSHIEHIRGVTIPVPQARVSHEWPAGGGRAGGQEAQNTLFQSSFMLTTTQPSFAASWSAFSAPLS